MQTIIQAEQALARGDVVQAGRLAEAALLQSPQAALALNVLGHVAARRGDGPGAVNLWETACRIGPALPQPWVSLGEAQFHLGQYDKAVDCFRAALARQPDLHEVRVNYGITLQHAKRHEEAIEQLRRGLAALPDHTEAAVALATSLHEVGRTHQAIDVLKAASDRHPENAKLLGNLGVLHEKCGQLQTAVEYYDKTLRLVPNDAGMLFNRGSSLIQLLRVADARRDWEESLRIRPDDAHTKSNLAILELLDGNYPKGFDLFEARWAVRHKKFPIPLPEWDGASLAGKHILLYVEQGLGDMLQFCRFVPVLKQKYGCRITLAALPTLHELLRSLPGVDMVVDIHPPYPMADVQCSLLSVPRVMRTTLETIPTNTPYLKADPARVTRWRNRLAALSVGGKDKAALKVGLYWQGTQTDPNRVIRLSELAPLWQAADTRVATGGSPGLAFISLQKGPGEEELAASKLPVTALGHELLDFSDTAAVLESLDLLITIDTAIAHAAGAMGRKAWVMLPYRPDWRWLLDRQDSPWYPTLRLYRQTKRQDWSETIAQVAADLQVYQA